MSTSKTSLPRNVYFVKESKDQRRVQLSIIREMSDFFKIEVENLEAPA